MGQTSNHADALKALIHLPDGEDLRVLDDDTLSAYATKLRNLVDLVSQDLKYRDIAKFMREAGNDSHNCDIVTFETVTTDRIKKLNDKTPPKKPHISRYRKREDLPDPSRPANAEVNIKLKKIGARISPEHIEMFNQVSDKFYRKRDALEAAIELLVQTHLDPK